MAMDAPGFQDAARAAPGLRLEPGGNHPVGADYRGALFEGTRLHFPSRRIPGTESRVEDLLVDGRVECLSCHAISWNDAVPGSRLMRRELQGPAQACLVCHDL